MSTPPHDHFTPAVAQQYDERNRALAPIGEHMHFLVALLLDALPSDAEILCVGVGTGAEVLSLAAAFPGWRFVGVDPSAAMLEVCRDRLAAAGVQDRCELRHGYVHEMPDAPRFDAVLSMLVGHFVPTSERGDYYAALVQRARPGGTVVNVEVSCDLDAPELPAMLEAWAQLQRRMGAPPESLVDLPARMRSMLAILPHAAIEALLREAGIAVPVRFLQSFLITGWFGARGV
ncbi:MAG: class I SAM-dependent methyltransferase [Deltaproteobacteria bacterium]|nr:class I SAM-dependent methyltransferase [Deltaproteobacteria bacterium]MBK8714365.1 class I SAM-dependent methyltransferase [Deltaproteobacteria bacterium]MBP7289159.1 class I SAM-dependent methyltransferase [Nannocystaceae bacterium]